MVTAPLQRCVVDGSALSGLTIEGATVLGLARELWNVDIRIVGDVIVGVGRGLAESGDRVIDAAGMVAMPGFINAHTHSGQHLDRGVTPNLPLDLWLAWTVMSRADCRDPPLAATSS